MLHALAWGLEEIHGAREYHSDLHEDNVIVRRLGIEFDVKLVDMYKWGTLQRQHIRYDVYGLVRLFYHAIGGAKHYPRKLEEVKKICCGHKQLHINRKFRTVGHRRSCPEEFQWAPE